MRVAAIMNTIDRYDITPMCTEENIKRAGQEFDLFITDNGSTDRRIVEWGKKIAHKHTANETNMGNAYALNRMLFDVIHYDFIVKIDNDMLMPENWLTDAINSLKHDVGMVGWKLQGQIYGHRFRKHGINYEMDDTNVVIGSTVVRGDVARSVGYFNEWSKYGHWDAAYCRRLQKYADAFYLQERCHHIGTKQSGDPAYEYMKQEEAKKAFEKAREWHHLYGDKKVFLTLEQKVV